MSIRTPISYLSLVLLTTTVFAANPQTGPVISDYGPVFDVANGAYSLKNNTHYKVSMDVSTTSDSSGDLNRRLESAARFLNMHARDGVDAKNIEYAIVVHGGAARDLLKDDAYEARFDGPNPNTALLSALGKAGVEIYVCGQTAAYRGFTAEELNPVVTMALSAMSAHVRLQSEGYTLIPF